MGDKTGDNEPSAWTKMVTTQVTNRPVGCSHVTFRRHARWIDYGPLRFSFVKVRRIIVNGSQYLQTLLRVSDRKGKAALYEPTNGGFVRVGMTSGEVLPAGFISMNIYDRSQIELELLEAEEHVKATIRRQ